MRIMLASFTMFALMVSVAVTVHAFVHWNEPAPRPTPVIGAPDPNAATRAYQQAIRGDLAPMLGPVRVQVNP